jgi:ADP-ribose pyrophosphatase YjhB (NUDIX family)
MNRKGIDYPGICVVFFCHDGHGNVIMGKRSTNTRDEHGCWDIGGGGVELGDSIDHTIRSEIKSEYGTDVLSYEFLGYRDVHREHNGEKTHWIALDFNVHVDKTQIKNGEPHKFDEVKLFRMDSLPTPQHSQFPAFFEKYKDKL